VLNRVEESMGAPVSLEIVDDLPDSVLVGLADEVFGWLHEVDRRFSPYRPDSEVSQLAAGELTEARCSAQMRQVLERCAELLAGTNGYFDVHVTGALDPCGYVKGWAVQVASDRLLAAGAANHCLNAAGDIRVRGHNSSGQPWHVGIRHPWDPMAVCCVIVGADLAVATSGTYERGPHVLDPHTGGAAAHGLRSVTVVGPDLGTADAYATAALAMGRTGLEWLAELVDYQSAAVTDDGQFYHSPGLPVA